MTRKPPNNHPTPDLAVLKTEGQPYHPDPEVLTAHLMAAGRTPQEFEPDLAEQFEEAHRMVEQDAYGFGPLEWKRELTDRDEPLQQAGDSWIDKQVAEAMLRDTDSTNNPYLIESSTVLGDLAHEAHRARLAINALDHEIEHLTGDADFQIRRITARRDQEIAQREKRKDDLMKIVAADTIVNGVTSEGGQ